MITLGTIRDINDTFNENWLIVRSLKKQPRNTIWLPDLSPNTQLFFAYRDAEKAGQFNQEWFQAYYVPAFLRQIENDGNAKKLLNQLYVESRTKNILLACFCTDETLCHRSIVGGLLAGANASIRCNPEYKKYYDMYWTL